MHAMFVVTGRETILAQAERESASLCRWYCPLSVGTVRCRRRFVLVVCLYYLLSAGVIRCPSLLCRCRLLVLSVVGVALTLLFVGIESRWYCPSSVGVVRCWRGIDVVIRWYCPSSVGAVHCWRPIEFVICWHCLLSASH